MMLLRQFIPQEAFVSSLVRKVNLSSINDKTGRSLRRATLQRMCWMCCHPFIICPFQTVFLAINKRVIV